MKRRGFIVQFLMGFVIFLGLAMLAGSAADQSYMKNAYFEIKNLTDKAALAAAKKYQETGNEESAIAAARLICGDNKIFGEDISSVLQIAFNADYTTVTATIPHYSFKTFWLRLVGINSLDIDNVYSCASMINTPSEETICTEADFGASTNDFIHQAYSGNDVAETVSKRNVSHASFDMKRGDDTLKISADASNASFQLGEGNDIVAIAGNADEASLQLQSGNDTLCIKGSATKASIQSGDSGASDDDRVYIIGSWGSSSIQTGIGNDFVQLGDLAGSASIDLGDNIDVLRLTGDKSSYNITNYGGGSWQIVRNGRYTSVQNTEAILFADGTFLGSASAVAAHNSNIPTLSSAAKLIE